MVLNVATFAYGAMQPAYVAAQTMGSNGYWGLVLAFVLAIPVIALLCSLGKRFPKQSIIQYLPCVFGKFLGKCLGFLYLAFVMALMAWASRAISEEISIYFLNRTPMWASVLIFLAVAFYVARQGIEGITRLAAFIFPLTFLFGLLAILFSFQSFRWDYIRPIFLIDGFRIPLGAMQMFYLFFPLLIVLMIYPRLTEKQKGFKTVTGAATLVFAVILLTILSGIGNYSAPGVLRYGWSTLELARKASLPSILQTFGLFYAVSWLSQALVGTGFFYYILSEGMSELFNGLDYKWFTLILLPLTFLLILLPAGVVEVHSYFPYLRTIGFYFMIGLPLLVWLAATLRKRGKAESAS